MVWPVLIGAAIGAAQQYEQQKQAERQRRIEAAKARYSSWTGMQPGDVQEPSMVKNIGGGALAGYQMQQGMGAQRPEPGLALDPTQAPSATATPYQPPAPVDYSTPQAAGYSPWMQMGQPQRPPYMPPGR